MTSQTVSGSPRKWTPPAWLKFVMKYLEPGAKAGFRFSAVVVTSTWIFWVTVLTTFLGAIGAWFVLTADPIIGVATLLARACAIGAACNFNLLYAGFAVANIILLNLLVYVFYAVAGRYGDADEPAAYVDDTNLQAMLYLLLAERGDGAESEAVYERLDSSVHDRLKEIWDAAARERVRVREEYEHVAA